MTYAKKKPYPLSDIRTFLEPGPIVLVASAWKGRTNLMTMGWHMIMGQEPSLVGCFIWDQNHSFEAIRRSKECTINVPPVSIAAKVVKVGNCSGRDTDKFAAFGLTPTRAKEVAAPLVEECFASFECKLVDSSQIKKYGLFVFEVVAAHVAPTRSIPKTIHYRGEGRFMIAGDTVGRYKKHFEPGRM